MAETIEELITEGTELTKRMKLLADRMDDRISEVKKSLSESTNPAKRLGMTVALGMAHGLAFAPGPVINNNQINLINDKIKAIKEDLNALELANKSIAELHEKAAKLK
jgi:hypothetical protein